MAKNGPVDLSISNCWDWPLQHQDGFVMVTNNEEKFEVSLEIQLFRPNEIDVRVCQNELVIHCRSEPKNDEYVHSREESSTYSDDWLNICAPIRLGAPALLAPLPCPNINNMTRLKNQLKKLVSAKHVSQVLECHTIHGQSLPCVLLVRAHFAPYMVTLRDVFGMRLFRASVNCVDPLPSCSFAGRLAPHKGHPSLAPSALARHIATTIIHAIEDGLGSQVVLTLGPKNVGKSTFCRLLCNSLLSEKTSNVQVWYLDTDVGQTEFTLSGCVSLKQVSEPFLTPPLAHMDNQYEHAFFYGKLSTVTRLEELYEAVVELHSVYKQSYTERSCLVVNTHGWLQDTGLQVVQEVCKIVQPNHLVQIQHNNNQSKRFDLDWLKMDLNESTVHVLEGIHADADIDRSVCTLKPAEIRDMTILSYFSRVCTDGHLITAQEAQPFCVRMSLIGVWVFDAAQLDDRAVLTLLNGSLVALCSLDPSLLGDHFLGDRSLPRRCTASGRLLRCVGMGMIRAIDPVHSCIYVLSPLAAHLLNTVNVLARGDINMPHALFASQANMHVAPYVLSERSEEDVLVDVDLTQQTPHLNIPAATVVNHAHRLKHSRLNQAAHRAINKQTRGLKRLTNRNRNRPKRLL